MNEETQIFPAGLTKDCFLNILAKEFGDVQIKSIRGTSGSKAGNNYLSEISRITIDFLDGNKEKSISIIIKDTKKASSDIVNMICGIDKELSWYANILSEFEKLSIDVGAKSYLSNENVLILNDLSESGYKIADRIAMLDLDHSKKALEALAKFHAVTHHLFEINKLPEISMKNTQFAPGSDKRIYEDFKIVDKLVQSLKSEGYEELSKLIMALKPNMWSKMQKALTEKQDFLSLVHGDYWTSNILFKYGDNKEVLDAKILDFQLIRLATPAYDLHFFVCSSVQPSVRDNHLGELFQIYLDTLNFTLESISSKSFLSQEQFDRMMKESSFIGPFIALTFLPIPLSEVPLQFLPPNDLPEEDRKDYHGFHTVYKQKTFMNHFVNIFKYYKQTNAI